jgi:polar amino acid transport system substrate-binding protein
LKTYKFSKVLVFIFIFLLSTSFLTGCKKTATEKLLKVGTSADYPPFEYIDDQTQQFVGFDLDLMRLIAPKMGYDGVDIINMDFDTIIPSLETGKIDVAAACISIDDDRLKVANAVPYFDTGQTIIVKSGTGFNPTSLSDLSGKSVGVQKGTTGEGALDDGIANGEATNVDVRRYTSVILGMLDLQNGKIDAMIIDKPVADLYATQYAYSVSSEFISEMAGLFVKKDNTELFNSLQNAFDEVKNSTEWDNLIEQYFSGSGQE